MRKRILFLAFVLVGCASQDAIPEVKPARSKGTDCGLSALVAPNPSNEERTLGSCGGTLEQLDDSGAKRK